MSDSPAVQNLKAHQQQLDADGVMVGVSRQALDEALAEIADLESRLAAFAQLEPPSEEARKVFAAVKRDNPDADMRAVPNQWLVKERGLSQEIADRLAAAEAARDSLLTEAEKLRDDLLMRADVDSDGTKVVAAGFTRWLKFKEAINAARGGGESYDGTYVEDHCDECGEYLSECICADAARGGE